MNFYGFYWNTLVINRSTQELLEVRFPEGMNGKLQLVRVSDVVQSGPRIYNLSRLVFGPKQPSK